MNTASITIDCSPNTDFELPFLESDTMDNEPDSRQSQNSGTTSRILNKQDVLTYFDFLIENNKIIVGQHCGDAQTLASYYDTYVEALADFPHYDALKSLKKAIVMSEIGPREASSGQWDMMELVNDLRGKAAYFLQWHSWNGAAVAIKDNENIIAMMNSEAAITLYEPQNRIR